MGKGKCLDRRNMRICCCSSQICVIVIGIVYIVAGILSMPAGSTATANIESESKSKETLNGFAVKAMNAFNGLFTLVLGIVLVVGASMRKPVWLQVWIVVSMIQLVLFVIFTMIITALIIFVISENEKNNGGGGSKGNSGAGIGVAMVLLGIVCVVAFYIYLILCVTQYRNELQAENRGVGYYNPSQVPVNYQSRTQDVNAPSISPSQQAVNSPSKDPEP